MIRYKHWAYRRSKRRFLRQGMKDYEVTLVLQLQLGGLMEQSAGCDCTSISTIRGCAVARLAYNDELHALAD